jgi:CRP-like cAMP-binding protein
VVSADIIFVLAGGRLVEEGTHDELLAAGGLYHQLWIEQNGPVPPAPAVGPDVVRALAAVPLLADVPDDALAALGRLVSRELYEPGTEVGVPEGERRGLLVVLEGELELLGDGREPPVPAIRLGPGDFVGEMSLLREDDAVPTLRAATPVQVLTLGRADFLSVAGRHPELQHAVLRQLSRRTAALASAVSVSGLHESLVR